VARGKVGLSLRGKDDPEQMKLEVRRAPGQLEETPPLEPVDARRRHSKRRSWKKNCGGEHREDQRRGSSFDWIRNCGDPDHVLPIDHAANL